MVKDMLDESSFDASPGHVIPDALGKAADVAINKITGQDRPPQH
ncbi:hypothetical protein [Amycolatopsis taiwanensis]|uniref:Uncharacterized protein n=1 Tax=Amycolatopsis taiwanensis TaxID=342230 RepID=A0A9W6R8Y8_9PSEU|nr:hypothetical protein [Amycolatopsis taiwanensis]GLY71531.1 hypothetical protein Atai01_81500 [Amycolatopsis taiwanensis]